MTLRFLNQAGFVLEHGGRTLLCDPWLHGRVFNDGWELISKTSFDTKEFANIDYIWFSHEHPDHFSPPSLSTIPQECRKNITILYHSTADKRVVSYCQNAGFKAVVELDRSPYELACDFVVSNVPYRAGDSWLHCRVGNTSVLNTNDCVIADGYDAARIKRIVGHVDLLMTKFSYAGWTGNPEQRDFRRSVSKRRLADMKLQVDFFRPSVTVPIASHIFFCHEENHYLNDCINTPRVAHDFLTEHTSCRPAVLYPNDTYTFGQEWDSEPSLTHYEFDLTANLRRISNNPAFLSRTIGVFVEEIALEASIMPSRLGIRDPTKQTDSTCAVFLSDFQCSYHLSRRAGLIECGVQRDFCDLELSSEMLLFCLRHPEHADSVRLSGRMRQTSSGSYLRFLRYFGHSR